MPPPPIFPRHPIRVLRNTLGSSRAEFAKLIGTSVDTIVSLENARLEVSKKLARRISFVTGANLKELLRGPKGKLLNSKGKPYTRADFSQAQEKYVDVSRDVVELYAQQIQIRVKAALLSAAKAGDFVRAYCDIDDAVEEATSIHK